MRITKVIMIYDYCMCMCRFLISQIETRQINNFPVLRASIVNVKLGAGWIDLKGNPT